MADDSVPLPYPNLKVSTWYYQIQHVDYKKDEAEKAFWEAVEKDGMFPGWIGLTALYMKSLLMVQTIYM